MNQTQLMQQHILFQKSWTKQSCSHGKRDSSDGKNGVDLNTVTSRTDSGLRDRTAIRDNSRNVKSTRKLPPLEKCRISPLPVAPPRSFHRNHGNDRNRVTRPWREKVPNLSNNTNQHIEIHYSKIAPKDKWMEYKPKRYVSNPKYGSIYEIRRDTTIKPEPAPPPSTWLWENEFRLWRLDKNKTPFPPRSLTRKQLTERKPGNTNNDDKPHAELFAAYNAELLRKEERQLCAIEIQRHVRGWLIRKAIKELKHQVLRGLSMTWRGFVQDYRELVIRIKSRYGVMDNSCRFNLREVTEFVHTREKYERVFSKMARWEKLDKLDLPDFFTKCDLYPTEGEISHAFNTIFRGSQNTAEVVFVLDCSASFGPATFQHQVNFVKDVVLGFDVAPDRIRVGVVPYNESVFHCFGLSKFKSRDEVLEAMDNLQFKNGLTRTELALKMMRQLFKSSRPGVQKIALILTDGNSPDPEATRREAKLARDEYIDIFAIGVGHVVDKDQLRVIARDVDHVKTCTDYSCLSQFKNLVQERMCLRSDQADGKSREITPNLLDVCRPLTKHEVMDIVWTVYPPKATGLEVRKSRWIRPIVDGTEAWSVLDDEILQSTNLKQCLRLVIQAKLERDGVMDIPNDLKLGVQQVSNLEEALEKIDAYIHLKKQQEHQQQQQQQGELISEISPKTDGQAEIGSSSTVDYLRNDHHQGTQGENISSESRISSSSEAPNMKSDENADNKRDKLSNEYVVKGHMVLTNGTEMQASNQSSTSDKMISLDNLYIDSNAKSQNLTTSELDAVTDTESQKQSLNSGYNKRNGHDFVQSKDLNNIDRNSVSVQINSQPVTQILQISHDNDPSAVQSSLQILTINHKDHTEIFRVKENGKTRKIMKFNDDGSTQRGWSEKKKGSSNIQTSVSDPKNACHHSESDFNQIDECEDKFKTWVGPNPFVNQNLAKDNMPEGRNKRDNVEDTSYFT